MNFSWMKNYLPRGIYGRAALILILPVLLLQLLVSVVFIQRHFDGVTRLMTRAVSIDLQFLIDSVNEAESLEAALAALDALDGPLRIRTQLPAVPGTEDVMQSLDLTAQMVINWLREEVENIRAVSLADRGRVVIWVDTAYGVLEMNFGRRRVSAPNPHQLIVIMAVMGAIMTAIAYIFLRNQLRPIKRMAAAAADYGKGRVVPFHPTGALEVRAAGMAFLDMRNRLERQTQSRTMMLSGVSHDLRTPLTRLRLGLTMLDEDDVAPLQRDVADMQRLLDAFLDFARSDAGDNLEPINPRAFLQEILEDAARLGQSVHLGQIDGEDGLVRLRPLAIRRALENLLGNALRYGTQAVVGLTLTERTVRFTVEDDGPGIPADRREEAVNPFVRLDPARNQDQGSGVGLGLAIVSDIARTHGGVLRLGESETLGGLKAELVLAR
ncbi:ATP-binding protein [Yoonia sediminilitoris]|uniref:histidine kinase n=1 Tax=Yoonia sediminilitoris TaxID=1286148 RepID=A0A2T6KRU2_9RHOB|nr:ATP-binding protein [Yoonia sediminilitoris]PUB19276.1 two-component system osmolarity sensor histidine kinase EnvZ [Yoonia sediminilitoris]RCW99444.1 two-component system osmolarity sensor histidine kinase EnvZ [Yoonia sediminilitoris]